MGEERQGKVFVGTWRGQPVYTDELAAEVIKYLHSECERLRGTGSWDFRSACGEVAKDT